MSDGLRMEAAVRIEGHPEYEASVAPDVSGRFSLSVPITVGDRRLSADVRIRFFRADRAKPAWVLRPLSVTLDPALARSNGVAVAFSDTISARFRLRSLSPNEGFAYRVRVELLAFHDRGGVRITVDQ